MDAGTTVTRYAAGVGQEEVDERIIVSSEYVFLPRHQNPVVHGSTIWMALMTEPGERRKMICADCGNAERVQTTQPSRLRSQ